jgi:hypothetical protein
VLGLLVSLLICTIIAAWPGRWTFTVSPETTYVTGPLEADGSVDYVTALNERLRGEIKPETNANVLLWRALGPRPEGGSNMPGEYFGWLGVEAPAEVGTYFISYERFLDEEVKYWADPRPLHSRRDRAARWPWSASSDAELAGWMKRVEGPLMLTTTATRRPDYYKPLVPDRTADWSPGLVDARLPNVQRCRLLAQALCIRAMLRLNEGKADDAWQDLLVAHRLGRLVARGGSLIELLTGFGIDATARGANITFVGRARLTSASALACRRELEGLAPMSPVAEKIDQGDRFMVLDIMMQTIRQGPRFLETLSNTKGALSPRERFSGRLFTLRTDWDPAFRKVNDWFDRSAGATRLPTPDAFQQEWDAITGDLRRIKGEVQGIGAVEKMYCDSHRRGEIQGDIFASLMLPAFDKVQHAAERFEQSHRNLRLAFALAAFHADRGRYPAKLDELVPKYLEQVPNDLFTGGPLTYLPNNDGYMLYSVGPNRVDDEGRGYDDEPRGDDITIRMPVPEPAPRAP